MIWNHPEEQHPTNRINRPESMTMAAAVMPRILNHASTTRMEVARGRLAAREGWMKGTEPVYVLSKVGMIPPVIVNVL